MGFPQAEFRRRLLASYRTLVDSIEVETYTIPPQGSLALVFRAYVPEIDQLPSYLEKIARVCDQLKPASMFVASDSPDAKAELLDFVNRRGIPSLANDCHLSKSDLDRSTEGVRGMCMDLKSLTSCELGVISNNTRSSVPDSLRAFGVPAYHTFDDLFHRSSGRDELFESQPVSEISP